MLASNQKFAETARNLVSFILHEVSLLIRDIATSFKEKENIQIYDLTLVLLIHIGEVMKRYGIASNRIHYCTRA